MKIIDFVCGYKREFEFTFNKLDLEVGDILGYKPNLEYQFVIIRKVTTFGINEDTTTYTGEIIKNLKLTKKEFNTMLTEMIKINYVLK